MTSHGGESAAATAGSAWRGQPPAGATASLVASPSFCAASVPDSATFPVTSWFPVVAASPAVSIAPAGPEDHAYVFLARRSGFLVPAGGGDLELPKRA